MSLIHAPISYGELLDKITILEIKSERIADAHKLRNVRDELALLNNAARSAGLDLDAVADIKAQLKAVNERLWKIEDDIRDQERRSDFGPAFIALARAVYIENDLRADLKKQLNIRLGSRIQEEKSYADYRQPD